MAKQRSSPWRMSLLLRNIESGFNTPERPKNIHGKVSSYELDPRDLEVFQDIIDTVADKMDFPPAAPAGLAPSLFGTEE